MTLRLLPILAAALLFAAPAAAQDDAPFFDESCGALFQEASPAFKRGTAEMPAVMMFTLGWYTAAGADTGAWVTQIANRRDVVPSLFRHCVDAPEDTFLQALAATVPEAADIPPDARRMMFDAPCETLFGPPPKRFLRPASDFELLIHFALGYWAAKGGTPGADAEARRPQIEALYARCMETPEAPLLDALRATVPAE